MWSCLQPHLCAGGPSMMMFTHRICMALRGLGRLHTVDRVMRLRAAMLLQGKGNRQPPLSARTACGTRSLQRTGCLCLRAQLEADEVLDVVEDAFAFLHRAPEREARVGGQESPGGGGGGGLSHMVWPVYVQWCQEPLLAHLGYTDRGYW